MNTLTSRDGTIIAYEKLGNGPPVVLVDGAFCHRAFGPMPALAALLSKHFTVFHYDRRGRGDSGDTAPYAVEREVEDLKALVDVAGGSASVYGISSGAALSMLAVADGLRATKLAIYEPPFALDGKHHPNPADFREQIATMLASNRRDDAVKTFMKVVGVPTLAILFMRCLPNVWPKLRAVAHTLPYDFAVLGDTQTGDPLPAAYKQRLTTIGIPMLAMAGSKSPPWMHHAVDVIAALVPNAKRSTIAKQDHNVSAKAMAPSLVEFFG
jgi:pimeloyl-ACP methyl ester carboxylesterase